MQITFDTTTITDDEVRGIFALLDTVRPSALAVDSAEEVAQAVEEKIANGGYVHTKETLPGPVALAEETVEERIAEFEKVTGFTALTVDSTGLPWHPDIHASSKALNADGTWRTKRGVDKALVAEVEAELRATLDMDAADGVTVAEVLAGPSVVTAETAPPMPPAPPAPEAPIAPVETAPVAPSSAVSPFVALMKRVTTAQGAGKLTQPRVKELLESLDKKSIMDLRTDEDALASFAVLLDGEGV